MVWYIDREQSPEYVQRVSAMIMQDTCELGLGVPYDERTPEQKWMWQRQADPHYERIEPRAGGRKPRRKGYRR